MQRGVFFVYFFRRQLPFFLDLINDCYSILSHEPRTDGEGGGGATVGVRAPPAVRRPASQASLLGVPPRGRPGSVDTAPAVAHRAAKQGQSIAAPAGSDSYARTLPSSPSPPSATQPPRPVLDLSSSHPRHPCRDARLPLGCGGGQSCGEGGGTAATAAATTDTAAAAATTTATNRRNHAGWTCCAPAYPA